MKEELLRIKLLLIIKLITISIIADKLYSNDFIWPTDASTYITSSFAEYRPGHFHAGIDIKTWNKVGYKVFAIEDGYIWRIRVSPFGYGRVIYQKLNSGEIVIYAHLQKFNTKIEELVKREQKKKGEFRLNLYLSPNRIPVKKGEIIAYTGASGIGSPHLHFEIRDNNNQPMNPFLVGYEIDDTVYPGISGLSITPLDADSRVNSDVKQLILRPVKRNHGHYVLSEDPLLFGNIGFAIDCWDKANGVNNVFAVYRINFYVDDELKFSSVYDKFSYNVTNLIDLDRDYRLNKRGVGLFQKLYIEQGNNLPFYKQIKKTSGIIQCNPSLDVISDNGTLHHPGPHDFLVELYDFNGNLTTLHGKFYLGKKKQIFSKIIKNENSNYYIIDIFDEEGDFVSNSKLLYSLNHGRTWNRYKSRFSESFGELNPNNEIEILKSTQILRINANDIYGNATFPFYSVLHNENADLSDPIEFQIEKDFYDDYIRIELSVDGLLKTTPRMFVQQIGLRPIEVDLVQYEFNTFFGVYKIVPGKDGLVDIEAYAQDLSGKEVIFWDQFDISTITRYNGGMMTSKDGKCFVKFNANAVYKNLYLRISKETTADTNKYDFVSAVYDVNPHDMPLKRSAIISLTYPENDPTPDKLGVYNKANSNQKRWRFSGNNLNPTNRTISARLSNLRRVALIRDTEPPEIYIRYPYDNSHITRRYPTISARVRDQLSGFEDERAIEIILDGKKVISEYDPETKTVKYTVDEALEYGPHSVAVRCVDNCGNEKEVTHTFQVVNRK